MHYPFLVYAILFLILSTLSVFQNAMVATKKVVFHHEHRDKIFYSIHDLCFLCNYNLKKTILLIIILITYVYVAFGVVKKVIFVTLHIRHCYIILTLLRVTLKRVSFMCEQMMICKLEQFEKVMNSISKISAPVGHGNLLGGAVDCWREYKLHGLLLTS